VAFASYGNKLGLKDASGNKLTLAKTTTGSYRSGSYYDHVVAVVNESLNNFRSDTTFPYTPSTARWPGRGPAAVPLPSSSAAPSGASPSGAAPSGAAPSGSASSTSSTTDKPVQSYIDHLNSDTTWVTDDAATNTAKVSSLEGFVKSQKSASKGVGAFDGVDRSATENVVLGIGSTGLHLAPVSKDVVAANETRYSSLSGWTSTHAASGCTSDFARTDNVGKDVADRLNMDNPMSYLSRSYNGFQSSTAAPHWRIRTGIMQGDTASTVEINLALALQNYGIRSVDFATVWGQGHTMAERTGDGTTNFISWVKKAIARWTPSCSGAWGNAAPSPTKIGPSRVTPPLVTARRWSAPQPLAGRTSARARVLVSFAINSCHKS
jgi:hypothetical protein